MNLHYIVDLQGQHNERCRQMTRDNEAGRPFQAKVTYLTSRAIQKVGERLVACGQKLDERSRQPQASFSPPAS